MNIEKLAESAEKTFEFAKQSKKSCLCINAERFIDILNYGQFDPEMISVKYLNCKKSDSQYEHKLTYKGKAFITRTWKKVYNSDEF